MKTFQELQAHAIKLFQDDNRAMAAATKARETANKNLTAAQKEVEAAESAFKLADSGPSAKHVGEAFIAVREACKGMGGKTNAKGDSVEGGKEWGAFMRKFESSRNRVNYCIRVAEGKATPEARAAKAVVVAKKKPHLKVIKTVANDLGILVRYAARFDRKNGDKLLEVIIDDIRKLYEETFTRAKQMEAEYTALRAKAAEHYKAAKQTSLAANKKSQEARTTFKAVPFDVDIPDKAKGAAASV